MSLYLLAGKFCKTEVDTCDNVKGMPLLDTNTCSTFGFVQFLGTSLLACTSHRKARRLLHHTLQPFYDHFPVSCIVLGLQLFQDNRQPPETRLSSCLQVSYDICEILRFQPISKQNLNRYHYHPDDR